MTGNKKYEDNFTIFLGFTKRILVYFCTVVNINCHVKCCLYDLTKYFFDYII